MGDVILKVENLSKQYRLGVLGTGTLSHDINRWWHKIRNKEDPYLKIGEKNDRNTKGNSEYVWALKDINFEVKQGEVLGIIGKNGAGKSTLLKILSKITSPTTGSVKSRGRIASLLEVGTGFHPEMTGRENIFLNGAILGMSKKEISSKLDEIIGFSGCERYIDTPTKRYSSGMKVRLAFAVAAFLEPEILVVDEVLAVGDAEFQKKAIGKMKDISNTTGRTVLFVSHNMTAVQNLCTKALIVDDGSISYMGDVEEAIQIYLDSNIMNSKKTLISRKDRKGNQDLIFSNISFNKNKSILSGKPLDFQLNYKATKSFSGIHIALVICTGYEERIMVLDNGLQGIKINLNKGEGVINISLPQLYLLPGSYSVNIWCAHNQILLDYIINAGTLQVDAFDYYNTGKVPLKGKQGLLLTEKCNWSII